VETLILLLWTSCPQAAFKSNLRSSPGSKSPTCILVSVLKICKLLTGISITFRIHTGLNMKLTAIKKPQRLEI
jgi:hypothetical protein